MNGESAAEVQIRYRAPAVPCVIRPMADGGCEVRFDHPLPAVTPGQAAVFYRGEQVLGGGWIERALALGAGPRLQITDCKLQERLEIPKTQFAIWNLSICTLNLALK